VKVDTAVVVEEMRHDDWPAVRRIYSEGIAAGQATFETEVPDWEAWDRTHLEAPRLVARERSDVVAWAALVPVSPRPAYRGVAEVSVYVAEAARGRGVGRALLEELVRASERAGIWTLQAVLFPENEASLALHRGVGFRQVGRRERIASLRGEWRDTLLLERRSPIDR
jgi:L-amino acid N-acyltransferase YncA